MTPKPGSVFSISLLLISSLMSVSAQTTQYPDKIRGYKVERTVIDMQPPAGNAAANNDGDVDQLITFGSPSVARVTPLGITFEVPVVVAPVRQSGKVEFLSFEDIEINGRSVQIEEYRKSFSLPNKQPLTLQQPLRIYVYLPGAVLAALGEWSDSKDTWPVTGRIYVFGKFKKSVLGIPASFKRCVPVELNLTMRNPLKEK